MSNGTAQQDVPLIFLSYAHGDNETDAPDNREIGWIDRFHDQFLRRLKKSGKAFRIWRDIAEIPDAIQFPKELEEIIASCHIMIPVISPLYVSRKWCLKELEAFLARPDRPDVERLVPVFRMAVAQERLPELARDRVGYRFYEANPLTGKNEEYFKYGQVQEAGGVPYPYNQRIDEIVDYVASLLPDATALKTIDNPEEKAGGVTVFVADPAADMFAAYDRIGDELRKQGIRVLTEQGVDLSRDPERFETELAEAVSQSQLVLHLLGEDPGELIGDTGRLVDKQLSYTFAGDTQRLIWAPEILFDDPTRPDARERKRRPDPFKVLGYFGKFRPSDNVFKAPLEAFLQEVLRSCRALTPTVIVDQPMLAGGRPNVYVVGAAEDTKHVDEATKILFDVLNLDARPSVFEGGSSQELISLHRKSMTEADALLYCWGDATRAWIMQRAHEATEIARDVRHVPYRSTALLPVHPLDEQKSAFRGGALIDLYLPPSEAVTATALKPFADKVLLDFAAQGTAK